MTFAAEIERATIGVQEDPLLILLRIDHRAHVLQRAPGAGSIADHIPDVLTAYTAFPVAHEVDRTSVG